MFAVANDAVSLMMSLSLMMSASPNVGSKHHIIATNGRNIIFAKQIHHFKALSSKCATIRVMLIASCKTAKENSK